LIIVTEKEPVQQISEPFNVQHPLHVDRMLNWVHDDPDRSFDLLEKLGEGYEIFFFTKKIDNEIASGERTKMH
jgi:hypothetical protein